jgi:asparagine synthase (glutamine-hydrolysing)
MCGIAGVVEPAAGPPPSLEGLRRMASSLCHRGPDDEGFCASGQAGLAHRRLSIIDLSGGHQPIAIDDGSLQIVFNGEIYNFPEVKRELEARGVGFRSRSDTEVILRGYAAWGPDVLPRLNGMFSFAIWDLPNRRLFAARDRLGKKPFYYSYHRGRFAFGSEIKAVLAYGEMDREIDALALEEFLTTSCIAAPRTIFRSVRKLPPGHYLQLTGDRLEIREYWSPRFRVANPPLPEEGYLDGLGERFRESVRRRLISDVPLGALLSGGVDSSAVVAMMAQLQDRPVKTYTIGFDEKDFSEIEDARVVARHFGTEHHEHIVRPDAIEVLPDLVWHFDEPFGDASAIPTYYVSRMAAADVKVVLAGDGGDELFAGYTRYVEALEPRLWRAVPEPVRRALVGPLAVALPLWMPGRNQLYRIGHDSTLTPGYGLGRYPYVKERLITREFRARLGAADEPENGSRALLTAEAAKLDRLSRLQYLDTVGYLPNDILAKVDRASMAHGLEVRAPLLDYDMVEYVATIPPALKLRGTTSKYLFKKLCSRFLPESVFHKRKQGFAVPLGAWFRTELRERARETLLSPRSLGRGYFEPRLLEQILRLHAEGQRDYSEWLWNLLILEEWHRAFVDPDTRRV